jgi:hypothetical protein
VRVCRVKIVFSAISWFDLTCKKLDLSVIHLISYFISMYSYYVLINQSINPNNFATSKKK